MVYFGIISIVVEKIINYCWFIKFDGKDVYSEREITDDWARYF